MKKSVAAVLIAGVMAIGVISSGLTVFAEEAEEKTYTVTYNLNDGNTENMPGFQFLSGNMKGITSYDSRMYVEIDLTLDGKDGYKLVSDCYVMEKRQRLEMIPELVLL